MAEEQEHLLPEPMVAENDQQVDVDTNGIPANQSAYEDQDDNDIDYKICGELSKCELPFKSETSINALFEF